MKRGGGAYLKGGVVAYWEPSQDEERRIARRLRWLTARQRFAAFAARAGLIDPLAPGCPVRMGRAFLEALQRLIANTPPRWPSIGTECNPPKREPIPVELKVVAEPPPVKERPLFAWYSEGQAERCGTVIYARADGSEVECSSVNLSLTVHGTGWPDMIPLGPVDHFVRRARPRGDGWIPAPLFYLPTWHRESDAKLLSHLKDFHTKCTQALGIPPEQLDR